MSGRVNKNRGASANLEAATTTLNERILKVSEEDGDFPRLGFLDHPSPLRNERIKLGVLPSSAQAQAQAGG